MPHKSKPQSSAEEITSSIGPALDEITMFHNKMLVGVYIQPGVTKGGIILTDDTLNEDKWQGKVGLVLKKGPIAFKDDARNNFNGQNVEIGDWIVFRVNDTSPIQINGVHCRLVEDIYVIGAISTPEIIW